jgi:hypothetical protein
MNTVFVTSAVNATFSIYKPEVRLQQTLETLDSIRKMIPDSRIILMECSIPEIDSAVEKKLTDKADHYVNLSADETIGWIAKNIDRADVVKNLTEALALRKMVAASIEHGFLAGSTRLWKLSGRYYISQKFDYQLHTSDLVSDRFVFRKKNLSQFRPEHTGVPLQLQTRMYSFPMSKLDRYQDCLALMTEMMQDYYNNNKYIDIEHLWYKLLDPSEYVELDKIGVGGFIAPNGQQVDD